MSSPWAHTTRLGRSGHAPSGSPVERLELGLGQPARELGRTRPFEIGAQPAPDRRSSHRLAESAPPTVSNTIRPAPTIPRPTASPPNPASTTSTAPKPGSERRHTSRCRKRHRGGSDQATEREASERFAKWCGRGRRSAGDQERLQTARIAPCTSTDYARPSFPRTRSTPGSLPAPPRAPNHSRAVVRITPGHRPHQRNDAWTVPVVPSSGPLAGVRSLKERIVCPMSMPRIVAVIASRERTWIAPVAHARNSRVSFLRPAVRALEVCLFVIVREGQAWRGVRLVGCLVIRGGRRAQVNGEAVTGDGRR